MRDALLKNDIFMNELIALQDKLWIQLQDPKALGLSTDEHKILLQNIIQSKHEVKIELQHPLFFVLNVKSKHTIVSYFTTHSPSILDNIEHYLNTTYPEDKTSDASNNPPASPA